MAKRKKRIKKEKPKGVRIKRERKKVEFTTNIETLSLNSFKTRNAISVPFDDGITFPEFS